jgi:hypothetical protein
MHLRFSVLSSWLLPLSLLSACGGTPDTPMLETPGAGGAGATATGGVGATATGGKGGNGALPNTGSASEYTFETSKFSVPAGQEVFKCQDFSNPFGKDIGIVEMVTDLTPGSHHMFAFVLPAAQATLTGSLVDCPSGGVEFHEYLTTNGSPETTTTYPAGVGRMFTAGNSLRLNVHLINTDANPKDAFVKFTVHYVDPATLDYRAAAIFLNQVGVRVPPGQSTQSRSYTLSEDVSLIGAGSHMHKQGTHFVAQTNTGETIYDGTDWQEPKPKLYAPPLNLTAGTTITWSCTYQNDTGRTLTFGESALTNEMCIFPGEFYNKSGVQISYQAF